MVLEFDKPMDKQAVKVVKVIALYFLAPSGEISVEVISRRRHCKQLWGGMEIQCQLEFTCTNKLQMKCLKELLAGKSLVKNLKMQTNGLILLEPPLLPKAMINDRFQYVQSLFTEGFQFNL